MALDERAKTLIQRGDHLFSERAPLMSLWQEIADNFYVERADFTLTRWVGRDFAEHLMSSYPLLCRRDLGNSLSEMLRPTDKEWFKVSTARPDRQDNAAKRWLAEKTQVMRRAMLDRRSLFHRATKEGDHDFAAFGQNVISVELNRKVARLLYRCWHLRDVVWCENFEGKVDTIHRKWKPTAQDVVDLFGDNVAPKVKEQVKEKPYDKIEVRHIVMPSEHYEVAVGQKKRRQPFVSIYIDVTNGHIMEEVGSWNQIYVVPRWQTVSCMQGGSQYAYSPATVAALPDGRLIQAMTRTLLEAGEKYTNPPMIAVQEMIRSDVALYAGAINWVDADYDERTGEVLRPLTQNQHGFPYGEEMVTKMEERLKEAFFLNKLSMPTPTEAKEMTAFEVGQRVQEYIRQALPLFEPMEMDYNGGLCDITFDLLWRGGAFGSPFDMPQSLRGQDIQFEFESPLSEAIEAQKGTQLAQAKAMIAQVADLDPTAPQMLDAVVALRDALEGVGTPPKWIRDEKTMADLKMQSEQQAEIANNVDLLTKGAAAAKGVGDAAQSIGAAGLTQPAGIVGPPTRQ